MVKNAAAQAIEEINNPEARIPRALTALHEQSWLLAYAAQRNVGVSPGQPAVEMLRQVLQQGSEDEQMAALYQIQRMGFEGVFPAIFTQYCGSDFELREAAYHTIWQLAANGEEIPSPMQYGMA